MSDANSIMSICTRLREVYRDLTTDLQSGLYSVRVPKSTSEKTVF